MYKDKNRKNGHVGPSIDFLMTGLITVHPRGTKEAQTEI